MSAEFIDGDTRSAIMTDKDMLIQVGNDATKTCELVATINAHPFKKVMAIDLDAGTAEDEDLGIITTSKINLQKFNKSYQWDDFNTYCNVSESEIETTCRENHLLGASCAGYLTPESVKPRFQYRFIIF